MLDMRKAIKTELSTDKTLNGTKKIYSVYNVPIEDLNYNIKNDRILDKMSNRELENLSNDQINSLIEDFIWEEEPSLNKKTMKSIELRGQEEYGVVLYDGTVVDGNRRFTCLRKLHKQHEVQRYSSFKAIILSKEDSLNEKAVKSLELQIQHGQEQKVDYDPINKALAVYKDIEERKLFTIKEYSDLVCWTIKETTYQLGKGILIEEFLEYINHPKEYDIAKLWKLDGPIHDIYLYKNKDDEIKTWLFDFMLANAQKGDWKKIREFIKQIKADRSAIEKYYIDKGNIIDNLHDEISTKKISVVKNDVTLGKKVTNFYEEVMSINDHKIIGETISDSLKRINKSLMELDYSLLIEYRGKDYETAFLDFKDIINELNRELNE